MFPHERSLVKRLEGKPFALIGVNSDTDKDELKKQNEKHEVTWRSFWNGPDGTDGPIARKWNVRGWPTIYVIDPKGVIRFRDIRDKQLDRAVDELLAEMEKGGGSP